jgi:hypothetical protein
MTQLARKQLAQRRLEPPGSNRKLQLEAASGQGTKRLRASLCPRQEARTSSESRPPGNQDWQTSHPKRPGLRTCSERSAQFAVSGQPVTPMRDRAAPKRLLLGRARARFVRLR